MLPPLATPDDLERWMGAEVHVARAEAILAAASTLVRTHTGRVWVGANGPEPGVSPIRAQAAAEVVITVAERVYRNPAGITQDTAGPYSRSVAAWAALGMSLTDTEKALLAGPAAHGIPGLSSVRVASPAPPRRRPWWLDDDED